MSLKLKRKKPDWSELRSRFLDGAAQVRADDLSVSASDAPPAAAWQDGPSVATMWSTVGAPGGWSVSLELSQIAPGALVEPSRPGTEPGRRAEVVRVSRAFSTRALAIAVVRFRASNPRPFSSARERHVRTIEQLVEVDDPASTSYPVVTEIAETVVGELEPSADPARVTADMLSAHLEALGYDRLWNRAWTNLS